MNAYEVSWSAAGYAASINCNLVPGVILKGSNIVPKANQGFDMLFAEWDWNGWIKPQIDLIHEYGGNTVRLIGDIAGVNAGTFTQSYYAGRWAELINYAASLGMYTYPAGGGLTQVGNLTITQVANSLAAIAAELDKHPTVIGFDIIQESVRTTLSTIVMTNPADLFGPVRSATTKPLTASHFSNENAGTLRFETQFWKERLRPHVDFWDIHLYSKTPPALIYNAFWSQGEDKPIVIGEYGVSASKGVVAQTDAYQQALDVVNCRYDGLHVAGALSWGVYSTVTNDYGMFTTSGTPLTHMTDLWQQLPVA